MDDFAYIKDFGRISYEIDSSGFINIYVDDESDFGIPSNLFNARNRMDGSRFVSFVEDFEMTLSSYEYLTSDEIDGIMNQIKLEYADGE